MAISHQFVWLCSKALKSKTRIMITGLSLELTHENIRERLSRIDNVTVIIPGNPGVDECYATFAKQLLHECNQSTNQCIITISHINHVPYDHSVDTSNVLNQRFGLDDQVDDKIAILQNILSEKHVLTLIGHSIGSYISLEVGRSLSEQGFNVRHIVGLFPTIRTIADTPNGIKFQRMRKLGILWFLMNVLVPVVYWIVPRCIVRKFFQWHFGQKSTDCVVTGCLTLFHPTALANMFHMAITEMDQIRALRENLLTNEWVRGKCYFLYGASDGWCPLEYGNETRALIDSDRVIFDERGVDHSFVINHSVHVAQQTAEIIFQ